MAASSRTVRSFQAQTIDPTKVSTTHVELTLRTGAKSSHASSASQLRPFVVDSLGDIEIGDELFELMGCDSSGRAQIAAVFPIKRGSAKLVITTNQVYDVDATTYTGAQTDIAITGKYPKDTTSPRGKGWQFLIATGYIQFKTISSKQGEPAKTVIEVTPYALPSVGAPWSFDAAITL